MLDSGLTDELKWKVPCYTIDGHNVLIVSAFEEHASISFFKGALLSDGCRILEMPGENSQAARVIRFASVKAILAIETVLKGTIREAIQVEQSGLKVDLKAKDELVIPLELARKFDALSALRSAWKSQRREGNAAISSTFRVPSNQQRESRELTNMHRRFSNDPECMIDTTA